MPNEVNIRNKRASFDYEFLEEYNAGIVLTGTEIKSIRAGKASLVDSYCFFNRGRVVGKRDAYRRIQTRDLLQSRRKTGTKTTAHSQRADQTAT